LKNKVLNLSEVESFDRDAWVVVGGVIDSLKKMITKKGKVMMFVTIQDRTSRMELLIFPKTYEETKDSWVEGNVVCVVGKTPKEEGDNKIFVEKAYVLNKQNIGEVSNYLVTINKSKEENVDIKPDKYIIININKNDLTQNLEAIKSFLQQSRGEYFVYFQMGTDKMKTNFQVDYSDEFEIGLKNIVGNVSLEVK